jgi:hypothetical protein
MGECGRTGRYIRGGSYYETQHFLKAFNMIQPQIKKKFEPHLGTAILKNRDTIFFRSTCISSYRDIAKIVVGYQLRNYDINDRLDIFLKAIKMVGNANNKALDPLYKYHLQLEKLLPSQNKLHNFQERYDAFKQEKNEKTALEILKDIGAVRSKYVYPSFDTD